MESPMLWDPIRYDETCLSSDGACAIVIGDEEIADRRARRTRRLGARHRAAHRTDGYAGRDQVSPQAGRDAAAALWKAAGIKNPIDEIDVAEIYVPFSLVRADVAGESPGSPPRARVGSSPRPARPRSAGLPVNASGGVLSSNPIGASGMIRFAESAIQVMGRAGDHQVKGARGARPAATAAVRSTTRCGWSAATSPPSRDPHAVHRQRGDGPLDDLLEIARAAERTRVRQHRAARTPSSHGEQSARLPVHPDGSRMWKPGHPVGRSNIVYVRMR